MAVFTRFSGGFCILRVCVAPAAPPPLWAVPGPPGHEKRTPTDADAHDLKIVVKLRAVPASKVPFPVEIAGFPDFSRPVPVYPAFLKYVVPVQQESANFTIFSRRQPNAKTAGGCTWPSAVRFTLLPVSPHRPDSPRCCRCCTGSRWLPRSVHWHRNRLPEWASPAAGPPGRSDVRWPGPHSSCR